jgi:hypothetical protein
MSDDREEQIRRLAEATGFSRPEGTAWVRDLATNQYLAGARIPDPPAPTLPVVSSKALGAFLAAYGGGSDLDAKSGLRAAWPILVRDNFAALLRNRVGMLEIRCSDGTSSALSQNSIDGIIAALTRQAHG